MEANTHTHRPGASHANVLTMAFAVAVYGYFFWVFLAASFFVGSLGVHFDSALPDVVKAAFPWSLDSHDEPASTGKMFTVGAALSNAASLVLFAVQHMVMARRPFKNFVTKYFYPEPVERSVFVLCASMCLHFMMATWIPSTTVVWDAPAALKPAFWGAYFVGWLLVLASTFMIDHFDLFGVSPAFGVKSNLGGQSFITPMLYKYIRHPIMTGFMVAFWAAPVMTVGRLFFAAITTAYIVVDVFFLEESDLKAHFPEYTAYSKQVGAFFPCSFAAYKVSKGKQGPAAKEE